MKKIASTLAFLLVLSGCATYKPVPSHVITPPVGIYHEVRKGETLWRISRAYGVSLEEIMRVNRLNSYEIKAGDILFTVIVNDLRDGCSDEVVEDFGFYNLVAHYERGFIAFGADNRQ